MKKNSKEKINYSLYNDDHPKTSTKGTGFKDKQKALDTLKIIKNRDGRDNYLNAEQAVKFGIVDVVGLPKIDKVLMYQVNLIGNKNKPENKVSKKKSTKTNKKSETKKR